MALSIVPVLLCGGVGSRLWPLSRQAKPKQFLPLLEHQQSLFQATAKRVQGLSRPPITIQNIIALGLGSIEGNAHQFLINEQLKASHVHADILLEPIAKDSAPAILAASLTVEEQYRGQAVLALPCDHYIQYPKKFYQSIARARKFLEENPEVIITFGIHPEHPSPHYGYILPDKKNGKKLGKGVVAIKKFKEKPSVTIAKKYMKEGYLWNSGIFLFFPNSVIKAFQKLQPAIHEAVKQAVDKMTEDKTTEWHFRWLDRSAYQKISALSFDYAIMQDVRNSMVMPMDKKSSWGWSDLGNFNELKKIMPHGHDDEVITHDARNNLIINHGKQTIALLGKNNTAIVASGDALLVADIEKLADMKTITKELEKKHSSLLVHHSEVLRPWGSYQSLEMGNNYQVKKIIVKKGAKLSLQKHRHRSEHWVVVKGQALVTIGDEEKKLIANQSVYIPVGTVHRLENIGEESLELIEVQTGDYLGEDDIERLEDKYRRS